jgi:hypothetical protein
MITRDDIFLQDTKPIGNCIMAAVSAIQRYPAKVQVVAAASLLALIINKNLIADMSVTELLNMADRLIQCRDSKGVNGAEAYMENQVRT